MAKRHADEMDDCCYYFVKRRKDADVRFLVLTLDPVPGARPSLDELTADVAAIANLEEARVDPFDFSVSAASDACFLEVRASNVLLFVQEDGDGGSYSMSRELYLCHDMAHARGIARCFFADEHSREGECDDCGMAALPQ